MALNARRVREYRQMLAAMAADFGDELPDVAAMATELDEGIASVTDDMGNLVPQDDGPGISGRVEDRLAADEDELAADEDELAVDDELAADEEADTEDGPPLDDEMFEDIDFSSVEDEDEDERPRGARGGGGKRDKKRDRKKAAPAFTRKR